MPPERTHSPERGIKRIQRLFIANRGEIAVRAAKACEKRGIQAVIPYSDLPSERESLATRMADKNMNAGWDLAPIGGIAADESYANPTVILENIKLSGSDAVFLGYGFLAENPDFVKQCEVEGIRVLAPSAKAMEQTGSKTKARELARQTKSAWAKQIPVLPGSPLRADVDALIKDAEMLGYPVMVKDPNQGGGAGNLVAYNREELQNAYVQLRFGENKGLFLEQYIKNAIHVEIQIAADQHGNTVALGERDCSMQRNYQKIIEESPSPQITDTMRQEMQEAAIALMKKAQYSGVGTVEFIVDADQPVNEGTDDKAWYFMEINPRIQVEHPVTEEQTGIDIVDLMIDIAEGKRLPFTQKNIKPQGHTIEVRLYAEDPSRNFEQQEGRLDVFRVPENMEGVRIDKGYEEGDEVSTWYDPTLCKVIAHGATRAEALHRLEQALDQSQIVGVKTNREFLIKLIDTPEFRQGRVTTHFAQEWADEKRKESLQGLHGIKELLGKNGVFTPFPPSRVQDEINFPVNPVIKTKNSSRSMTRREYMENQRKLTQKERGSEYGIIERDGVRAIIYDLNPGFNRGTFGKEEAWMLEDACQLANSLNLPLITVTSTAGVRNPENNQGLQMMMKSVADISELYPPLCHMDIRHGYVLGGVPASYSGLADIFIAVNTNDTKIALTGPYAVAKSEGLEPVDEKNKPSTRAEHAYKAIDDAFGEGNTHTPQRHHDKRTGADILVDDLTQAGDRVTHILHILKKRHPQIMADNSHVVFRPKETIGYIPLPHPVSPYDSPDNPLPGWVPPRISRLWEKFAHRKPAEETLYAKPLRVGERRRIVMHPDRLTALDCMDTKWGLFDDAVLLNHVSALSENVHQTVPVVAALVLHGEYPLMVIGQQPQQRVNEKGDVEVYYEPIRPADWRSTRRMFDLAEKLDIMVLELGNTSGAAADRDAEDQGQVTELATTEKRVIQQKTPVISVGYGRKGSGGGAPFCWIADFAASWKNHTAWVADLPAMRNFIEGVELLDEATATPEQIREFDDFAEQFHDATAEGQLENKEIDLILDEGPVGAHLNPSIVIGEMKRMLDKVLPDLWKKHKDGTLLAERAMRMKRAANIGSKPNPNYEKQMTKLRENLGYL